MDDASLSMLRVQVALLEARIEEAEGAEGAFHFRDGPGFLDGAEDEYHRGLTVVAFGCRAEGLTVTVRLGRWFIRVSLTIEDWPENGAVTIEATTHGWIEVDSATPAATWKTGAS